VDNLIASLGIPTFFSSSMDNNSEGIYLRGFHEGG
jgi:hypothetical protein